MKNIKLLSFLVFASFLVTCTKKEETPDSNPPNLKFTMGAQCGWGLRFDSLTVDAYQAHLVQDFWSATTNANIVVNSKRTISTTEFNNLESALDWNYFKSLNYNSGNLPVDGCDIWLTIENGGLRHQIRFSMADTIPRLRPLTDQLDSIWSGLGVFPSDMLDNF
tara:strand:+ start:14023 stop:14514 length:492 start_codon:yes stop_codon:yes gene_type:complete